MGRYPDERLRNGLQFIQAALRLTLSDAKIPEDIVLVAIDLENSEAIKPQGEILDTGIEVGLAILDTFNLKSTSCDSIISTYNFAAGSPKFGAAASRRFLFGESSTITTTEILQSIEALIPRSHNIILVGFELTRDLVALRRLKFDLTSSIYGVIDAAWIAREVFPSFTGALEDLLCLLKCPYGRLHCAGNDAHFVLRALLLLSVWDKSQNMLTDERVGLLKGVAYNPIQSSDVQVPDGQEMLVTGATRKKRKNAASWERRKALSQEEKTRGNAAFVERQRKKAAEKAYKERKAKKLRDANMDAQKRIQAERAQRRENSPEIELDGTELLS